VLLNDICAAERTSGRVEPFGNGIGRVLEFLQKRRGDGEEVDTGECLDLADLCV
jgi:hypothetical protein